MELLDLAHLLAVDKGRPVEVSQAVRALESPVAAEAGETVPEPESPAPAPSTVESSTAEAAPPEE